MSRDATNVKNVIFGVKVLQCVTQAKNRDLGCQKCLPNRGLSAELTVILLNLVVYSGTAPSPWPV